MSKGVEKCGKKAKKERAGALSKIVCVLGGKAAVHGTAGIAALRIVGGRRTGRFLGVRLFCHGLHLLFCSFPAKRGFYAFSEGKHKNMLQSTTKSV